MLQNNVLIRSYKEGDEFAILDLFRQVFNASRTEDFWKWQFSDQEMGRGWVALAEVNKELVGHDGLIRKRLNFLGRDLLVAQECDVMVRSDQQGKGIYTGLAAFNYQRAAVDGAVAMFGFNSFLSPAPPLQMRHLDWARIAILKHYFRRIGGKGLWGTGIDRFFKLLCYLFWELKYRMKLLRGQNENLEVEVSSHISDDVEIALKRIRYYEVLSIWKDVAYLKWRYENHPEHKYTFHVLRVQGKAEGFAVTRQSDSVLSICELLHRTKDVEMTTMLLLHILKYYSRSSYQWVEFYGHDNGFYDSAFASAGFKVQAFSPIIFGGKVFKDSKLQNFFASPHNWSISYGDMDTI